MMNKHATVFRSFQTSSTMKLLLAAIVLVFLVEANAQWYKFPGQAVRGQPFDLWHLLLWAKLWLAFLTLTVHDCIQDLMICGEHTGTWGGPTGRTQTNTFMPEETTTLPEEDQGANGPQRWSGECLDLCILSDHNIVLPLCCVSVTAMPGSWYRQTQAAVPATLLLIRLRTAGVGMEAIPMFTDPGDFLKNISPPANDKKFTWKNSVVSGKTLK